MKPKKRGKKSAGNPVRWAEIPVSDMERAKTFYGKTLGLTYQEIKMYEYNLALIKADPKSFGTGGALVKGPTYTPSYDGPMVYFGTDDIPDTLKKAEQAGGKTIQNKKPIGEYGFVAYFEDTEGNRIGLHSMS